MITVVGNKPVMRRGDNEIGVVGDNLVKTLEFSIDRIQGAIDLNNYSAWALIERSAPNGGASYSTMVTKATVGDKITISLPITANETKNYGYIYASIRFATANIISAFSNYGGTVTGTVKATSTAHGLSEGVTTGVVISGTTNYNGVYDVTWVDVDNFYFTATWVSDQTGWWGVSPVWQTQRVLLKIAKGINGETEAEALEQSVFDAQIAAFQEAIDSVTYEIGENGNWYLDGEDTGILADVSLVDLSDYEVVSNKSTTVNEESDDEQYPTAKATYTAIMDEVEDIKNEILSENLIRESTCIPFPSLEGTDTVSDFIAITAGQYYCVTVLQQPTRIYVYLYDESYVAVGGVHNGSADALWAFTPAKITSFPAGSRQGYGFVCPEGVAYIKVRWKHSWTNASSNSFADAGTGEVYCNTVTGASLIPVGTTANVTISQSTDYDGTFAATGITTSQFKITATWTQTRTGKYARYNYLASLPMLHVSNADYDFIQWTTGESSFVIKPELVNAYKTIWQIPIVKYVSPSGDDDNDGDTPETPYETFDQCVLSGANTIYAYRGEYPATGNDIEFRDLTTLRILPYDNGAEYENAVPMFPKIVINNAQELTELTLVDGLYEQTLSAGASFENVFTLETLPPVISAGKYNANCWQHSAVVDEDLRLKPVLTKLECLAEAGTFFWDGTKIYLNPHETDYDGMFVPMTRAQWEIWDVGHLEMQDVEFRYQQYYGIKIFNIGEGTLKNCRASYCNINGGFYISNANLDLYDCEAFKTAIDGFGLVGYGYTNMFDCKSNNNLDDGVSHHQGCYGSIFGGEFNYNGKGGLTPAYGAQINIHNAFCKGNANFGIGYLTTPNGHAFMYGKCSNCLLVDNVNEGLRADALADITAYGNTYSGNGSTTGGAGTITSY